MESEHVETNHSKKQGEKEGEKSMKGTVASLGILAAVIVVMWLGVYWIYMSRV
jgi:hypothetical protein